MSRRLSRVAAVNEEIAERGHYQAASGETVSIAAQLGSARSGTVSYSPEDLRSLLAETPPPGAFTGTVEVTGEGSVQAARRLHRTDGARTDGADIDGADIDGPRTGGEPGAGGLGAGVLSPRRHIGVLNFASARNPGGGYLGGARAQEEDLCRSALLYSCLREAPDYYAAHRSSPDLRYSHRVIFSPGVPVIRDDDGALSASPYEISFLTSPAPNAGQLRRRSPDADADLDVSTVLAERAVRVLAVAARHGVQSLVLGAWGCGVFRNDPEEVAAAFDSALSDYGAAFEQVVFAVWDRAATSANRTAFERRFTARRT